MGKEPNKIAKYVKQTAWQPQWHIHNAADNGELCDAHNFILHKWVFKF